MVRIMKPVINEQVPAQVPVRPPQQHPHYGARPPPPPPPRPPQVCQQARQGQLGINLLRR
jgi:hypothetical protein